MKNEWNAEIIRDKETSRRDVLRGLVDKFTWHFIGSLFLPSVVPAVILCAQIERYDEIMEKRLRVQNTCHGMLEDSDKAGKPVRRSVHEYAEHNGHMYNILPDSETRAHVIARLNEKQIAAYICYVPLH